MKKQSQMSVVATATVVAAVLVLGMVSSANAANEIRNTVLVPGAPGVQASDAGGSTPPSRPTYTGDDAMDIRQRGQNVPNGQHTFLKTIRWVVKARLAR